MMSLEETFGITLDEEGTCSLAQRAPLLTVQAQRLTRDSLRSSQPGAEKITTVQEAADLIQSQLK